MKSFEEAKWIILTKAKEVKACQPETEKAKLCNDIESLLLVVKENISWCFNHNMLTTEMIIDIFGVELLNSNNIYTTGNHNLYVRNNNTLFLVLLG